MREIPNSKLLCGCVMWSCDAGVEKEKHIGEREREGEGEGGRYYSKIDPNINRGERERERSVRSFAHAICSQCPTLAQYSVPMTRLTIHK